MLNLVPNQRESPQMSASLAGKQVWWHGGMWAMGGRIGHINQQIFESTRQHEFVQKRLSWVHPWTASFSKQLSYRNCTMVHRMHCRASTYGQETLHVICMQT